MADKNKPDPGLLFGCLGVLLAVLIPVLQANGVDVNWGLSAILYVVIITGLVWSFRRYGIPNRKSKKARFACSLVIVLSVGLLALYATGKQYVRDHAENLTAVRIVGVTALPASAGSVYVFPVQVENTTEADKRGTFMCVVAKPNIALKPFGTMTTAEDTTREHGQEDDLFHRMDDDEESEKESFPFAQDIPAGRAVVAYCRSSWAPSQQELFALNRGDLTLYVAGRIVIPGRSRDTRVDVDFCRTGSENFGLQNCFGHNIAHPHLIK